MKAMLGTAAIITVLLMLLLLVGGCESKECKVPADCGSNTKCVTYGCSLEGKCLKNIKPDCCGNQKCDSSTENKCTCPSDCGACTGKVTYNYTAPGSVAVKQLTAKNAVYACNEENKCAVTANPDLVTELKLTSTIEERNYFKIDLLSTFNKPFNTAKDTFTIRMSVSDLNPKTVAGGVSISSIQVLNGNYLMGEANVNKELPSIGSILVQDFKLSSLQTLAEDELLITLKVSYSFTPLDSKGTLMQVRRSTQPIIVSSSKVTFISP